MCAWVQRRGEFVTIDEYMTRQFPPSVLVAIAFLILLVQFCALQWHLYFYYWWLDIPLHMIGGLWVTLFGLMLYYRLPRTAIADHPEFVIIFAVAVSLALGLFWEIYEFAVDHAVGDSGHGLSDTLFDLVNDLFGAIVAAGIFIRGRYHEHLPS